MYYNYGISNNGVNAMARRRKSDTQKTLEGLIYVILAIPLLVVALIKGLLKVILWISSKTENSQQHKLSRFASIDLEQVDQMDGLTFEHYVADLLKKNGYSQVFVTNSSGDFGVDITAYKDSTKYAFQCKNYHSKLGVSPIQEVYSGAPKYNASACVVVTNSYFTPHARELAQTLSVQLWDRSELARMIRFAKVNVTQNQPIKSHNLPKTSKNVHAEQHTQVEKAVSVSPPETLTESLDKNETVAAKERDTTSGLQIIKKVGAVIGICVITLLIVLFGGILTGQITFCEHQWSVEGVYDATCVNDGYTAERCTACSATRQVNTIEALGHVLKETYRLDPTLFTDGKIVSICSRCNHEETSILPSYQSAGKNAPSKTDDGTLKYKLSENKAYYIIYDVVDSSVTAVTIPEFIHNIPVMCIGKGAFSDCKKLVSISIPNTITSIEESAFKSCSSLKHIALPESITSISESTFAYCSNLESVSIPKNLVSIDAFAFNRCSNLASITIPMSVTSIGYAAFSECKGLKSVYISDIAAWCGIAFGTVNSNPLEYAENLYLNEVYVKEIVIPDGVTNIGAHAFEGYTNFTSITIPGSVKSIGQDAFKNCKSLKTVYITDLSAWCNMSIDGYEAAPLNYADNLVLNGELITDLVIPSDVTSISKYTFYGYTALKNVTIHNAVTDIGPCAFAHCTGLTTITLPESVSSIGRYAFYNCIYLRSFIMGQYVTTIGDYAFDKCDSLGNVTYTGTVEQWNLIEKSSRWDGEIYRLGVNCTDGSIAKNGVVAYT